jgi:hypothetical protein
VAPVATGLLGEDLGRCAIRLILLALLAAAVPMMLAMLGFAALLGLLNGLSLGRTRLATWCCAACSSHGRSRRNSATRPSWSLRSTWPTGRRRAGRVWPRSAA